MQLEAENLRVELGGRDVLRGVSLAFRPGVLTGVIGANGAGKTTLLRALAGIVPIRTGTITLDERPIASFSRKEAARRVGYLAQKQETGFAFRVDETVLMGRHPHLGRLAREGGDDHAAAEEALRDVDAQHLAHRAVNELSGGELQRVLIARTLAAHTPVLLLDEPFANLDVKHCLDILDILRTQARAGRTVVVSVHDLNLAHRYCDDLALLHEGQTLIHADTRSVLTPERIERAFGVQARILQAGGERHFVVHAREAAERTRGERTP